VLSVSVIVGLSTQHFSFPWPPSCWRCGVAPDFRCFCFLPSVSYYIWI